MSSTALKAVAVVLVLAAVVLGFVAFRMSQGLTGGQQTAEPAPPMPGEEQVLAVVAVAPIEPYKPIPPEAVALVPIAVQPAQFFTDVGAVVGRTPVRSIGIGAPVTEIAFGSPNALAQAIPMGTMAMSLEISDVIAVGGFVRPGDRVDVLVYIRASGDEVEESQARVLLADALVLAYQEQLISGSADDGDTGDRRQRTAVLAVPVDDTTKVMLGASLGELRLALRAPEKSLDAIAVAAADQAELGAGAPMPEALGAKPVTAKSTADADAEEQDENREADDRVITLEELAAIEKQREADAPPPPPRQIIEIFQGTDRARISRPY